MINLHLMQLEFSSYLLLHIAFSIQRLFNIKTHTYLNPNGHNLDESNVHCSIIVQIESKHRRSMFLISQNLRTYLFSFSYARRFLLFLTRVSSSLSLFLLTSHFSLLPFKTNKQIFFCARTLCIETIMICSGKID